MINSAIATFFSFTEPGIDSIPIGSLVHVLGTNNKIYELVNVDGLDYSSSIRFAIDNFNLIEVKPKKEKIISAANQSTFISILDLSKEPDIYVMGILQSTNSYIINTNEIIFSSSLEANMEVLIIA